MQNKTFQGILGAKYAFCLLLSIERIHLKHFKNAKNVKSLSFFEMASAHSATKLIA